MPPEAEEVLNFWFGTVGSAEHHTQRSLWFRKDPAFDAQIMDRFRHLITSALAAQLSSWADAPESALAQVLLLDQFTRNAFRDTAQAFSGDGLALAAAASMVNRGYDLQLSPVQCSFVYLPFEHAEALWAQETAVCLFSRLVRHAPELESMVEFAERHRRVVERFGRFPHRNALLGRTSTLEELAFLSLPGSRF